MIASSAFGSMTIDGRHFSTDLMIYPDGRVVDRWWREAGHRLCIKDIEPLAAAGPEIIVAGTGVNGRMRPAPGLEGYLAGRGIVFVAAANQEAIRVYNEKMENHLTGACFHLYC